MKKVGSLTEALTSSGTKKEEVGKSGPLLGEYGTESGGNYYS